MKTKRSFKFTLFFSLILGLALSLPSYAGRGGVGGGGGSIAEMREAGALNYEQLHNLLKDNGRMVKQEALRPFFANIKISNVNDAEIREKLMATIGSSKKSFLEDLIWMEFQTKNCSCPPKQNACRITTDDSVFTCFDISGLESAYTNLADLGGIAVHEISRVRIPADSDLQDDNHRLAHFAKSMIPKLIEQDSQKASYYISKCRQRRGTTSNKIEACGSIITSYALQCAIHQGDTYNKILACSQIDTQTKLNCAIQRGDTSNKIHGCAR